MLELKHVSKTFNPGTEDAKTALDDLSLSVADGDFITIIGANGAGKSTLFGAICGTFLTDSGSIFLEGENITMQPQHRRSRVIGHLFQDPMRGSAPGMSIEENLALAAGRGGWLSHVSKADKAAFRDRLALLGMGLENRMKQPVGFFIFPRVRVRMVYGHARVGAGEKFLPGRPSICRPKIFAPSANKFSFLTCIPGKNRVQ